MRQFKRLENLSKEEIKRYKEYYNISLKSKIKILDIIATFVHHRKENSLLPLITLLSAKATGKVTSDSYTAAAIADHLYTATRIHDDTEDEPYAGGGFRKIGNLWKEKLSVLMGDYFLAQGLLLAVNNKKYELLEIFSKSIKEITEGELLILYNTSGLNTDKNIFLDIIAKKSGSLFSACTKAGAISAGADKESVNTIASFGKNFGIALFIKQELNYKETITNSKYRITLPLIISLENCPIEEKSKITQYIQGPVSKEVTTYIQSFTETFNGVNQAEKIMEEYKTRSLDDITEFNYTKNIDSLKYLVNLTI